MKKKKTIGKNAQHWYCKRKENSYFQAKKMNAWVYFILIIQHSVAHHHI